MKRIILTLIVLIAISCEKKIKTPDLIEQFPIKSTSNSGCYAIKIALPDNYDPKNKKYATIFVLDCDDNFNFVAYHSKRLSNLYFVENALVVGIGYGHDRTVDYTPTKADHNGGGAPGFMEFIKNELIPKLQTDFGADSSRNSRVIIGHSFGGLFGAYAFTKHNEVFGNYLMLSPSLWYDNEVILRYEQENREVIKTKEQLVFLGIGEQENSGRMQVPFEAFYKRLKNNYPGTTLLKNSVPQLDHVGSRNPNLEKALNFYFSNKD